MILTTILFQSSCYDCFSDFFFIRSINAKDDTMDYHCTFKRDEWRRRHRRKYICEKYMGQAKKKEEIEDEDDEE